MIVSYVGTNYHGFQIQSNSRTVQEEIQKALFTLTKEHIVIHGSGRTDSGVHARGQCFHFETDSELPLRRWSLSMNSQLPRDIVVNTTFEVAEDFHARRSALEKTYHYTINNHRFIDPFYKNYELHCPIPLDVDKMRSAIHGLIGEHDFTSFCSTNTDKTDFVRTIYEADIITDTNYSSKFHIVITGNGFLYNMVRIIAGTLIQVGKGNRTVNDFINVLEARDRKAAGPTALAQGLTLWHVKYDSKYIL